MKDPRPGQPKLIAQRLLALGGQPKLIAQRLLALAAAGALLFNFPLLKLWLTEHTVLGLPLLPVALFGAWALLIVLLARLMEVRGED